MTSVNVPGWDWNSARHLLNRAGFGGRPDEIGALVEAGREGAVESLLVDTTSKLAAPEWLAEYEEFSPREFRALSRQKRKALRRKNRERIRDLQLGWVMQMTAAETPAEMLRQKMTLFWHGHFATSAGKVKFPPMLCNQLQLLHTHATGNFRELLHGIVADPAMLRYLDNTQNRKRNPNENFARELMELFSLGPGNYTEADIKAGARALTGWTVADFEFRFRPNHHDFGEKFFLGQSGEFDGHDIVDIILRQPACAIFVSKKLLEFLGFTDADAGFVQQLGERFRRDYDIRSLLRAILQHPGFYRKSLVGNQIKSPIQLVVGTARTLGLATDHPQFYLHMLELMGQVPYLPPNVKGWPPGRAWIDTSRLLTRLTFSEFVAQGKIPSELTAGSRAAGDKGKRTRMERQMRRLRKLHLDFDPVTLFGEATAANELVDRAGRTLLATDISMSDKEATLGRYQTMLVEAGVRQAARGLIADLMRLPEYQLC